MSSATLERTNVEGHVSRGFEAVREAFAENFTRRRELGGACCAITGARESATLVNRRAPGLRRGTASR